MSIINNPLRSTLHWLLPQTCLACQKTYSTSHAFCLPCHEKLPFALNYCTTCGQTLAIERDYCGACLSSPVAYNDAFVCFHYRPPISDLLQKMKYANQPHLARELAALMANRLNQVEITLPEVLLPVPLHWSRLHRRGFNQAGLIAKYLGKLLNVPVNHHLTSKPRRTAAQMTLNRKQRKQNLRNAFTAQPAPYQHVAIIDDVITTGSTVNEMAKTLSKIGVEYIQVWSLSLTE